MELQSFLTILAILLAPLTALRVQDWLERRRSKRLKRLEIFRILMTTRASQLAPMHVQALNLIDVDFYGKNKSSKMVLDAWKAYLNHLNQDPNTPNPEVWEQRRIDLFVDLMFAMAQGLRYDFDKTHLLTTSYYPKGHGEAEGDQLAIRRGLGKILAGKAALPVISVTLEQLSGGLPVENEPAALTDAAPRAELAGPD